MRKLLCLIVALMMMLGCAQALAAGDDVAFAPYEERISMTVGRANPGSVDLPEDADIEHNKYLDYICDKLNIDVTYDWIAEPSTYNQKVNLAITSGDLPDVMIVTNKGQLQQLVENDLIEDLTGLADQYFSDYILDIYNSYADKCMPFRTWKPVIPIPTCGSARTGWMLWVPRCPPRSMKS